MLYNRAMAKVYWSAMCLLIGHSFVPQNSKTLFYLYNKVFFSQHSFVLSDFLKAKTTLMLAISLHYK